jgi:hypothetical protein
MKAERLMLENSFAEKVTLHVHKLSQRNSQSLETSLA